jgi:transcription initiation factor TFIID subunit 12
MGRSIQDLALSMDPNIKIEPEVEDLRQFLSSILAHYAFTPLSPIQLLLDIGDEFFDSVTNFGCRHRGGDTLEVRDLQHQLGAWLIPPLFQASWLTYHRRERNHNIRIPGFASDITVAVC